MFTAISITQEPYMYRKHGRVPGALVSHKSLTSLDYKGDIFSLHLGEKGICWFQKGRFLKQTPQQWQLVWKRNKGKGVPRQSRWVGEKVREHGAQSLRIWQEAWVFPVWVWGSEPGWVSSPPQGTCFQSGATAEGCLQTPWTTTASTKSTLRWGSCATHIF